MKALALTPEERSIVVFAVWQSLPYRRRMAVAFALVAGGLVTHCLGVPALVGWIAILAGNLLLVVRGCDNRAQLDAYTPDSAWERIDESKLAEFERFEERVKDWDRSLLDVSNPLGFLAFACLGVALVVLAMNAAGERLGPVFIVDGALLFVPHWFFGMRRVSLLMKPALAVKMEAMRELMQRSRSMLASRNCTVDHLVQLTGGTPRVPQDVKLRIHLPGESREFLGCYVQVVTNNVQGRNYPYVYAVVVAKRGYGLNQVARGLAAPDKITHEYESKQDVEYIVIRQTTTKKSGYHTDPAAARRIFGNGLDIAREAVALRRDE